MLSFLILILIISRIIRQYLIPTILIKTIVKMLILIYIRFLFFFYLYITNQSNIILEKGGLFTTFKNNNSITNQPLIKNKIIESKPTSLNISYKSTIEFLSSRLRLATITQFKAKKDLLVFIFFYLY